MPLARGAPAAAPFLLLLLAEIFGACRLPTLPTGGTEQPSGRYLRHTGVGTGAAGPSFHSEVRQILAPAKEDFGARSSPRRVFVLLGCLGRCFCGGKAAAGIGHSRHSVVSAPSSVEQARKPRLY